MSNKDSSDSDAPGWWRLVLAAVIFTLFVAAIYEPGLSNLGTLIFEAAGIQLPAETMYFGDVVSAAEATDGWVGKLMWTLFGILCAIAFIKTVFGIRNDE